MRMTHRLSLFSGSSGLVSLGGVSGGGGLVNSGSDLSNAKFNVETRHQAINYSPLPSPPPWVPPDAVMRTIRATKATSETYGGRRVSRLSSRGLDGGGGLDRLGLLDGGSGGGSNRLRHYGRLSGS